MLRTCYNCKYNLYCYLRHKLYNITKEGSSFLNIDSTESTLKSFTDLFTTLAECCLKYEEK